MKARYRSAFAAPSGFTASFAASSDAPSQSKNATGATKSNVEDHERSLAGIKTDLSVSRLAGRSAGW